MPGELFLGRIEDVVWPAAARGESDRAGRRLGSCGMHAHGRPALRLRSPDSWRPAAVFRCASNLAFVGHLQPAIFPAAGRQLVVLVAIAVFAEVKAELLAVFGMQQVLAKIAHVGIGRFIDADQRDLPRAPLGRGP